MDYQNKSVVIADVDSKSIKKLGQWPWSRNILAKITKNLTNAEAAVIGFDLFFSEPDNSSPINIASKIKDQNIDISKLEDYDKTFGLMLGDSTSILGYLIGFQDKDMTSDQNIMESMEEKCKNLFSIKNSKSR